MDKNELMQKIETEEDFIKYPKLNNSLVRFLDEHPNGVDDATIARLMAMTEEQVEELYQQALVELRKSMGIK